MSATLLEDPVESRDANALCKHCPAVERLERMFGELRREVNELRCEAGYWKSRHADAVKRVERLREELEQSRRGAGAQSQALRPSIGKVRRRHEQSV
jgi:small-conductance mechanosensitive channel